MLLPFIGRPAPYIDKLLLEGQGGVHHVWGCDHYKTTLNADKFKQNYKRRTDIVKDAMSAVPYGDRDAMVSAIVAAISKGGLFSVDVDIVPTQIGQASHVWLPAATAGEMNLTSMNGERRMRLTERYMDPPGQAMPDCLIAARLANHLEATFRGMGKPDIADKFKDFDWRTEEDAFMDGYHRNEKGGEFVTYARLRAMGTNGFQEPAVGLEGLGAVASGTTTGPVAAKDPASGRGTGIVRARSSEPIAQMPSADALVAAAATRGDERIIGTKRLYADGKFNTKDGKAVFMETVWRGLQAPGKKEESEKFRFLINNGRANHVWQSVYLDQANDFVMDRWPFPYIQMNPADVAEIGLAAGDLVEVYNDNGATQAMVYPTGSVGRNQTFMLFAFPSGVQGNVVSGAVNEFVIPNYKQTWGNVRKISSMPEMKKRISFKSWEYKV